MRGFRWYQEIANLFKQIILLVGQVFNTAAYQRRLSVLNTLIDNNVKLKQILKEPKLNLDAAEKEYLFGEKFEEKLLKIRSVKQKFKSVITGLQRKPNMMNQLADPVTQPFRSGSLPNRKQRGRG